MSNESLWSFVFARCICILFVCVFVCINVSLLATSSSSCEVTLFPRHSVVASSFTSSSRASELLLTLCLSLLADEASSGQDVYSPVHAHRIRERKYREETSYALLETDIASFDVREEIRQSISSINQLRIIEEQATPKNVTAQIGHTIFLHCIVEPIGDRMVTDTCSLLLPQLIRVSLFPPLRSLGFDCVISIC